MMHHASLPVPFPLFDQWAPSWPDVPAFAKQPDPSWFAYPSNPCPPARRRPHTRLEQTAGSPSSSRVMYSHSSRTRAHPIRSQVPPSLSALPALPISLPMPALEREFCLHRFGFGPPFTRSSQRRLYHPRILDRRCRRQRHSHLPRSFSMWCAMRHYWHPSRFHIDLPRFLTVSNFRILMRIYHTRPTRDPARSESGHGIDRMTLLTHLPLLLSDAPPSPYSED
jgi:hypothetical protein